MKTLAILLVAAGFAVPFTSGAVQRAITVNSLERAYTSRIEAIEAEIAHTEVPTTICPKKKYCDLTPENLERVSELREEKRSVEAAYKLLQEAFK